ncbi:hypothetical protein [Leucobacter sp. NPDC077196]|uniref:hypothetical protein n=1 Tax=Leucobacter sp. NPDC077196 TaxID=3154959 RepID=UPI00342B6FEA
MTSKDAAHPTAESPDSVEESVPAAADRVGQTGPDAADPPRAGEPGPLDSTNGKPNSDAQLDGNASSAGSDEELDDDEGADAFETQQEADRNSRDEGGERDDLDHITVDTPD